MTLKCLHNLECDECFARLFEIFDSLDKFFELVDKARDNNMMLSANAFAIKDLEKSWRFHLSLDESEKIWNRIQEKLKVSDAKE